MEEERGGGVEEERGGGGGWEGRFVKVSEIASAATLIIP